MKKTLRAVLWFVLHGGGTRNRCAGSSILSVLLLSGECRCSTTNRHSEKNNRSLLAVAPKTASPASAGIYACEEHIQQLTANMAETKAPEDGNKIVHNYGTLLAIVAETETSEINGSVKGMVLPGALRYRRHRQHLVSCHYPLTR